MLEPVRMQKIVLLATRSSENGLISALHRLGMVQVDHLELGGLEKGRPLEVYDEISRELVRVRSLISALSSIAPHGSSSAVSAREPEYSRTLAESRSISIDDSLRQLVKSKSDLAAGIKDLEKRLSDLNRLASFPSMDFSRLETKGFTFQLGAVSKEMLPKLKKDLSQYLKGSGEIEHAPLGKEKAAVLIFHPRRENIDFMLSRYGFERITLPQNFTTFESGKANLESELSRARSSLANTDSELLRMRESFLDRLLIVEKELSMLSDRASIAARFAQGRKVTALGGWLKKTDVPKLEKMLRADFANETQLLEYSDEEGAPIVLDNPSNAGQFQFLVEFYSLPAYSELDPTLILMFTVPIIYGMILGDVGYGLISIFLSLLILRKFKGGMLGNVAKIWLTSSIAAMFFGVVFDEWFGLTHFQLIELLGAWGLNLGIAAPLYEGLSRSHNLSLVIGLTVLAGVAQLGLGFLLGAVNAYHHDKKHFVAKIAWFVALMSGTLAVCSLMFNLVPAQIGNYALYGLVAMVPVIFYTEGLPGLFEIPGLAANAMSYARIAAAGAAGVIIAEIINEMFEPTPERGIFVLIIFILLHVFNAALAMFESIVQGGRLNLVEFYSKFFQGGGKAFEPFAMEGLKDK
ncbi:MAG: V-type ATPase 116kDa subunit family protein [Candidatus ainarchaeum sp.]|nr:V-type ATPase 116kDa subunit family protein [Candidatus ainarchaeum sp.]